MQKISTNLSNDLFLMCSNSAHSRRVGIGWALRSLWTQDLWFCDARETVSVSLLKKKKKKKRKKEESSPDSFQLVHDELLSDASHNKLRNALYHIKRVVLKTFRVPACNSPSCDVGQLGKAKLFLFFVYIMHMCAQVDMWQTCSSFLYIITSLSYSDSRKTLIHIFVLSHFLHTPERTKKLLYVHIPTQEQTYTSVQK